MYCKHKINHDLMINNLWYIFAKYIIKVNYLIVLINTCKNEFIQKSNNRNSYLPLMRMNTVHLRYS